MSTIKVASLLGIPSSYLLREMNYSVFIYWITFSLKKKKSVTLIKNMKYLWNYDAAFKF